MRRARRPSRRSLPPPRWWTSSRRSSGCEHPPGAHGLGRRRLLFLFAVSKVRLRERPLLRPGRMRMATTLPRALLRIRYEEAAEAYCRSLPLEHFKEATAQGNQRKITLESLDLVHADRPDLHVFNELLVQYPLRRGDKFGQVVPDNM